MSLIGLLIGVIEIIITMAILILIGWLVKWAIEALFNTVVPLVIQRLYMIIVALIGLVMLIELIATGLAPFRGWRISDHLPELSAALT